MSDKQPTLENHINKYCSCFPWYIKRFIHIIISIFIVIICILGLFFIFVIFPGIFVFPTFGDFNNFALYEEMYYGDMTQCYNITNITFHHIPPHYTDRTKVSFNGYTVGGKDNIFNGRIPVEPLYSPHDGLSYGEILDMLNDIQNKTFDCYVDKTNVLRRIGNKNDDWKIITTGYVYGIFSIIAFIGGAGFYSGIIVFGIITLIAECCKKYSEHKKQFDNNGRPIGVSRKSIDNNYKLESVA